MISFRPKNLRTRLTLWYVGVLAALLLLAAGGTSVVVYRMLIGQLYRFDVEEIETVEGLLYFTPQGALRLRDDYHNHPESKDRIESFLEVRTPEGAVLFRNGNLQGRALDGSPFQGEGVGVYSERPATLSDGTRVRVVSRSHIIDGRRILIRLAHDEEGMRDDLQDMLTAWLFVLPPALAAAGWAGHSLAGRALKPIDRMVRRAQKITAENLSERLPAQNADDELGRLARVFNDMLARLEQAFEQLRRFTSDCSHELRTPLAMIRSVGEVGLQKDGTREEYRNTVASMLEEVNRLSALVEGLLTISRADAGSIRLKPSVFRAMDLAREAAGFLQVLADDKGQLMTVEGDEGVSLQGDRMFLKQAVVNIIHNAVKYSPAGGTIRVGVRREPAGDVSLDVADNGPGLAPEHAAKVFDRFYRADEARSRQSGGAGLGLSIAQWAVRAHGGDILVMTAPGSGCTFRITLPPGAAPVSGS